MKITASGLIGETPRELSHDSHFKASKQLSVFCPKSGRILEIVDHLPLNAAMAGDAELQDLVDHLVRSTRLDSDEALHVIDEVLAYLSECPAEYVARRHAELRREGLANAAIFDRLASELDRRRFAAPLLSVRQLRRLVYG